MTIPSMARTLQRSPLTISSALARITPLGSATGSHVAQHSCQVRRLTTRPAAKLDVEDLP